MDSLERSTTCARRPKMTRQLRRAFRPSLPSSRLLHRMISLTAAGCRSPSAMSQWLRLENLLPLLASRGGRSCRPQTGTPLPISMRFSAQRVTARCRRCRSGRTGQSCRVEPSSCQRRFSCSGRYPDECRLPRHHQLHVPSTEKRFNEASSSVCTVLSYSVS